MPPLPSSEAADLISSLQRRQKDLSEFQIPQLRDCKGPLALQQNLVAQLREDIETFSRQVEELDAFVDDQKGAQARRELQHTVDGFTATLASLRKDSRSALLASKRAIDSQAKSRREELLGSTVLKEKQNINEKVTDDALIQANGDVTQALQRTISLMQGELERSVLSSQMLDSSSSSLRSTSSMHDTLNNVMGTSKQLITALEKSDWLDRLLIMSGLVFFLLVVLFILKQRIVDRGLRVAFWWTRFLPDFSGDTELVTTATSGEVLSSAGAVASTVLASLSPAFTSVVSTPLRFEGSGGLEHIASASDMPVSSTLDLWTSPSVLPDSGEHDEL